MARTLLKTEKYFPGLFVDGIVQEDYILDIDLDYFHTIKSINPEKPSCFYKLINNARIITIATEPYWVERERLGPEVNADYLLEKLLSHIETAGEYK